MGNEQKQENLNNQNIQEQEPKQMMPYVDNQDMKERATRFGTGGFAAIIYAVVTTICLYKNAYGIMTVLFAAKSVKVKTANSSAAMIRREQDRT